MRILIMDDDPFGRETLIVQVVVHLGGREQQHLGLAASGNSVVHQPLVARAAHQIAPLIAPAGRVVPRGSGRVSQNVGRAGRRFSLERHRWQGVQALISV